MAQPRSHATSSDSGAMDASPKRHDWQVFLKTVKWAALGILGVTFFLIIWLIGHAPLFPTLLIMGAAVFALGALFH
jgi:hypothetical protein